MTTDERIESYKRAREAAREELHELMEERAVLTDQVRKLSERKRKLQNASYALRELLENPVKTG